jgi:hypothetical protein
VTALVVFVDYDNVESSLTKAGPVNLAKLLIPLIPSAVIARYDGITVRLYGGWRSQGILTTFAQNLVPDIRAASPLFISPPRAGSTALLRLTVELADKPIGSNALLSETFVKERELRKFRVRSAPWPECENSASCGFNQFIGLNYSTTCRSGSCAVRMADVFVRDEQKMVDTLIVADIAHQALSEKASNVVVVSSDTDMWPGILLALRAGCSVTHIHTRTGWKTQRHLMATLGGHMGHLYQQIST